MAAERDLDRLLAAMDPVQRPGEWVFVSLAPGHAVAAALPSAATVVEDEGTTHVVERHVADEHGLAYDFVAAWLTLRVHSALDAVGLTAAVAGALAECRHQLQRARRRPPRPPARARRPGRRRARGAGPAQGSRNRSLNSTKAGRDESTSKDVGVAGRHRRDPGAARRGAR